MYRDCFDNSINYETVPGHVIDKLREIFNDENNLLEVSNVTFSLESTKKLFDSFVTDTEIAICFFDRLEEMEQYTIYSVAILGLENHKSIENFILHIKLQATNLVDLMYVHENGLPLIVINNHDWLFDTSDRLQEIASQVNYTERELLQKLNQANLNKGYKEDIYTLLDSDDEQTATEYDTADEYEAEILPANESYHNDKSHSDDTLEQLSHENESEFDLEDPFVSTENYVPGETFEAERNFMPQYMPDSYEKTKFEVPNIDIEESFYCPPQYADQKELALILPTARPYFPNEVVKNFLITNAIAQKVISRAIPEETVIGLFYIKDSKFEASELIKSNDDIYHTGVSATISNIQQLNNNVISLTLHTIHRVQINQLYLPDHFINIISPQFADVNPMKLIAYGEISSLEDTVKHSELKFIKKYATNALILLRKLLNLFKNNSVVNESFLNFRISFEEAFDKVFCSYEEFGTRFHSNNILEFFSSYQDDIDLIILKNEFLVEMLRLYLELKYDIYYKNFEDVNNLYFSLYNNNKKDFFGYYNSKFQEILTTDVLRHKLKLLNKIFSNEVSVLQYEINQIQSSPQQSPQSNNHSFAKPNGWKTYFDLNDFMNTSKKQYSYENNRSDHYYYY